MDLRLTCQICIEDFDKFSRYPRMLQCGHSFCNSCLTKIIVQDHLCPSCKVDIKFSAVEEIPVNFYVNDLVSQLQANKLMKNCDFFLRSQKTVASAGKKTLLSEGFCEEHQYDNEIKCMKYGDCVHGVCTAKEHQRLLVEEELKDMKENFKQVENSLKVLEEKLDRLKVVEENQDRFSKQIEKLHSDKSEAEDISDLLKQLGFSVAELSNDAELSEAQKRINIFLKAKKATSALLSDLCHTVQNLKLLSLREAIYIVRNEGDTTLFARVVIEDNKVKVFCFQTQLPEVLPIMIPFQDLRSLHSHHELPYTTKGFLKFQDSHDGSLFEVGFRIEDLGPRGRNFLLLCAGIRGPSFKGKKIRCNGFGFFLTDAPPPLVGGSDWGYSEVSVRKGLINGIDDGYSGFWIWTHDDPSLLVSGSIGLVETGLHHLIERDRRRQSLEIMDGGLIL